MPGRNPIGADGEIRQPPDNLNGVADARERRSLRREIVKLLEKNPKELDLKDELSPEQLAYWPSAWLTNDQPHIPFLYDDVLADMEMDPSNPLTPNESAKGPEITFCDNTTFVKRCYTFTAFINLTEAQDWNHVSRSLPARLQTYANSPAKSDIISKVREASGDIYRKTKSMALKYALFMVNTDSFVDATLDTQAQVYAFIKSQLDQTPMLRPRFVTQLVGHLIDSQYLYQDLLPTDPKLLQLRQDIRYVLDQRLLYAIYCTLKYRVCFLARGPRADRGRFDEFVDDFRIAIYRQNEQIPVPNAKLWPVLKTIKINYRDPWSKEMAKDLGVDRAALQANAVTAPTGLVAPVYPPGVNGPGTGPIAAQQRQAQAQAAQNAAPPPIQIPNPLTAGYQLPPGYVASGFPASQGHQWAFFQVQPVQNIQPPPPQAQNVPPPQPPNGNNGTATPFPRSQETLDNCEIDVEEIESNDEEFREEDSDYYRVEFEIGEDERLADVEGGSLSDCTDDEVRTGG
ncbi:hypothetical protein V8E51_020019 [Hyaloscypha variabilis]